MERKVPVESAVNAGQACSALDAACLSLRLGVVNARSSSTLSDRWFVEGFRSGISKALPVVECRPAGDGTLVRVRKPNGRPHVAGKLDVGRIFRDAHPEATYRSSTGAYFQVADYHLHRAKGGHCALVTRTESVSSLLQAEQHN